jgi:hypothetical protein
MPTSSRPATDSTRCARPSLHPVPMISYPFFRDQPALAKTWREFGLAIRLADSPRGRVSEENGRAALDGFLKSRDSQRASLAETRAWKLRVLENRDTVVRQINGLIQAQPFFPPWPPPPCLAPPPGGAAGFAFGAPAPEWALFVWVGWP